jgi:hypothetical protein
MVPGRYDTVMSNTEPAVILPVADSCPGCNRSDDLRLALLLTYITLGWMAIEGGSSLFLGWLSKSLLLEALGIDSGPAGLTLDLSFPVIYIRLCG